MSLSYSAVASSARSRTMTVRLLKYFSTRPARPRPRAWKRFIAKARPTVASLTNSRSTSSWWLFSALAMAACSTFLTSSATRRGEKVNSASALDALFPRMLCATRLSLRALTLMTRRKAFASVSSRRRGALCLLIALSPFRLLVGSVAVEGACRRELAELVANHVLGDQHRDELVAVIDAKGQADELREDRRAPRPGLDDLVAPGCARLLGLLQEVAVDERPLPYRACHLRSPLLLVAPTHDVAIGRLVVASLLTLRRLAPRGHRMTTARGAAFAAAMRMIDRVHRNATHRGAMTKPAIAPRLGDDDVLLVRVRYRADGGAAIGAHHAHLTRRQAEQRVAGVAADELGIGAGGARHLAAFARLHLDIVDDRADRHVLHRHRVARLDVDLLAGHHLIARLEALRRQDIGLLAIIVFDEGDERCAVRVVFEPLDRRHHVALAALEVDDAIAPLGAAAAVAHGDAAGIVATTLLAQAFGQRLDRVALPQ